MAFERLTFLKDWTNSEDFPTHEDSEAQVREDLQFHPNAIRDYLNKVLLAALEDASASRHLGASVTGVSGTLQDVLDAYLARFVALDKAVVDLAAGDAPEAVKSAVAAFSDAGWVENAAGLYELRLTQSAHKRLGDGFGYHLQSDLDGEYRGGTWETVGTAVSYDAATGDMVLTAEQPYSGRITFFGV